MGNDPAALAKVLMAELASLKLENKPWPGGKAHLPAGGTGWHRSGAHSLQEGESGGLSQQQGLCQGGRQGGEHLKGLAPGSSSSHTQLSPSQACFSPRDRMVRLGK